VLQSVHRNTVVGTSCAFRTTNAGEMTPAHLQSEPDMVFVPAGEFLMGSDPKQDPHARQDEQPQHKLYLADFSIGRTPVTNMEYAAFLKASGYHPPSHWKVLFWKTRFPPISRGSYPVVNVSWHDARAYCEWLSHATGSRYRLPTEAEWEKAARGTDARIYPWGDTWVTGRCHVSEDEEMTDAAPVGAYPEGASPYGVQDMLGNVWEWTQSLWGRDLRAATFTYPYDLGDGRENGTAASDVRRILRGVSFYSDVETARCASRYRYSPRNFFRSVGFRIVKE